MKLVIVESPTKAKTLAKYLPKDQYYITSSRGHIRDLPKKGLGVDIDNGFEPEYEIPEKAKKTLTELKKLAKEADEIILATDPDREGEAIAWHLQYVLSPQKKTKRVSKSKKKSEDVTVEDMKSEDATSGVKELADKKEISPKFSRVFFHELTKDAVLDAFNHPSQVDEDLVNSQQARRVLDRLVGYKLSPLLWKKVQFGLSAGRVQSVAVRLVVEKERERLAFKSQEYWTIDVDFESDHRDVFTAGLIKHAGKKLEISSAKQAQKIVDNLSADSFKIEEIVKTQKNRQPPPPFKTSTLQRAGANVFGFSAKKTMSVAQKLFEKGHITYHRTDSLSLSPAFVDEARAYLKKYLGEKFLPSSPRFFKTNSKGAQEAHEAIRPTNIKDTPKKLKLTGEEYKIYSLIWQRSLECQSVPAVYDQTRVDVISRGGYLLRANGSIITFMGWLKIGEDLVVAVSTGELSPLPELKKGTILEVKNIKKEQHFTQPPARYSDATLIKKLEDLGIGRPSTYAPTIATIEARKYILRENRYFYPSPVAFVVTDLLVQHFPSIVDYDFTAKMENDLDAVAEGKNEWPQLIKDFFDPFAKTLELKEKELNKRDVTTLEKTDKLCPECKKNNLVVKLGKFGKFLSCSGYPDCEYAEPLEEDKVFDEDGNEVTDFGKCDKCDGGVFILRQGRFGKFLACSNYPKCKNTKPYLDKVGIKCPKCGEGDVVRKKVKGREFFGCSKYPDCDYSSWKNPVLSGQDDAEFTTINSTLQ